MSPVFTREPLQSRFAFFGSAIMLLAVAITYTAGGILAALRPALLGALIAALVLLASLGIGYPVFRRISSPEDSGLDSFLVSVGIGSGILAGLVFIPGVFHISITYLVLLILLFSTAGLIPLSLLLSRSGTKTRMPSRLEMAVGAIAVLFIAETAAAAAGPPVFWDSLTYHLALPERWLNEGRIAVDPFFRFSMYPANTESLYALGLALGRNMRFPGLLNLSFIILSVLAVFSLARRLLSGASPILAAAVFGLLPATGILGAIPKNDAYVTFLVLDAFLVLFITERWSSRRIIAAGLLLGFAAASKYTALLFIPAGVISMILTSRGGGFSRLKGGFLLLVVSIASASPPYLRNIILLGDPLAPHLSGGAASVAGVPPGADALRGLLIDPFLEIEPLGLGSTLGPLIPLLLIALLFAGRGRREEMASPRRIFIPPIVIVLLFLPFSLLTPHGYLRFIYPAAAFLSIGAAAGLASLRAGSTSVKRIGLFAFFSILILNLLLFSLLVSSFLPLKVHLGIERPADYIARFYPQYPVMEEFGGSLPQAARILVVGDPRTAYWDRVALTSAAQDEERLSGYLEGASGPDEVVARLRDDGITHILIAGREGARLLDQYSHGIDPDSPEGLLFQETIRNRLIPLGRNEEGGILFLAVPRSDN